MLKKNDTLLLGLVSVETAKELTTNVIFVSFPNRSKACQSIITSQGHLVK